MNDNRILARLLMAKTTDEWVAIAARHKLIREGLVDLAGRRLRFNHRDLDLRRFHLESADLTGSVLINPLADGASFRSTVLRNVKVTAEPGKRGCMRSAVFDGALIEDADIGPTTLDLSAASFREARLVRVTFRMGALAGARFDRASLTDVMLRGANLRGASFREATLERTNLERAVLERADFSDAKFREMEKWGEPDYTGATIADDLRYRFAVVRDPVQRLEAVLRSGRWTEPEKEAIQHFVQKVHAFGANAPEVMLIEREFADVIPPDLFRRVVKAAKQVN